jgi:cytochrome c-type biogenesis protein CcmE
VARKRSPARLVVALSVAMVLAVFLLYTSIAGGGRASLKPSQLAGRTASVTLTGKVVGKVTGDAHASGHVFTLREIKGTATVPVRYTGTVPDLFKSQRDISLEGRLQNGVFVAEPGTMITKCPSKYQAEKTAS